MSGRPTGPQWQPNRKWQARRIIRFGVPALLICIWLEISVVHYVSLWLGALSAVLLLVVILDLTVGRRRRSEAPSADLRALAAERGWTFAAFDGRFTTRWSQCPFGPGSALDARDSFAATDVVVGSHRGYPCAAFTYSYSRPQEKPPETIVLDVTTLALPAALPLIDVSPESIFGEFLPGMMPTANPVENETFNRRYRVQSVNPKYALDVLVPRTVEALLSAEPFSWRIEGRASVAWSPPNDDLGVVISRLDMLATIADNIPQFVWKDAAARI